MNYRRFLTLITDINGIVLMKWGIKYSMNMERVLALIIRGLIKEHLLLCKKTIPGNVMPAQGEIDVMKYGKYRPDMYTRLVAADEDVQGLIWLSRIKFDD